MRTTAIVLSTFLLLACHGARPGTTGAFDGRVALTAPRTSGTSCSDADRGAAHAEWLRLRTTYPYHLQTIALSPRFASGCRALIIAEPPSGTTLPAIQTVSPSALDSAVVEHHTVGYDGWTADVVFTIPPLSAEALDEVVADLNLLLFGTSYGTSAVDTSAPRPAFDPRATPLDVAVGPGDMNRWLFGEPRNGFEPLRGGPRRPFRDLLESAESGVYLDPDSSLIAWIIPRYADIAELNPSVRQFAVASDLILGSIASEAAVAVIARQRIVDPLVLPPLRFETVSLLAAVGDQQLAQSYERTTFLAGQTEKRHDWAPIYLSPALIDSEYGSILNIADQLLKSWSNAGQTQYVNFRYPTPATWPFKAPVWQVAHADEFRYNWNTTNVSAVLTLANNDVFWLRRTGALNVSYFPDENDDQRTSPRSTVDALEDTAYQYFATVQDPTLVRVVQYNALYQIFQRYALTSSMSVRTGQVTNSALALHRAVKAAVVGMRDADQATVRRRVAYLEDPRERELAASAAMAFSQAAKQLNDDQLDVLALALMEPRLLDGRADGAPTDLYQLIALYRAVLPSFLGKSVYEAYAQASEPTPGTWIHTPSIVLSWNPDAVGLVGGHDLSPHIAEAKYVPSRRAPAERDRVTGKVVFGPADLDRVVIGRHGPAIAHMPLRRGPREALGVSHPPRLLALAPLKARESINDDSKLVVARMSGGGYEVFHGGKRYSATAMPEVVKRITDVGPGKRATSEIEFINFTPDEARGVVRSAEINTGAILRGVLDAPHNVAKARLDFRKATIANSEGRSFGTTAALRFALQVPTVQRDTVLAKIKIVAKRVAPTWVKQALARARDHIRRVISRHPADPLSSRAIAASLHHELRTLLPEADQIDITMRMQAEVSDFTIVDLEHKETRGGTEHRPS